ncbi:MAG: hypothetical protein ACAI43_00875 [Phycisphaerae bacterium]|nr:hypothetical protein [Tepidisphaeraceae bacterium]
MAELSTTSRERVGVTAERVRRVDADFADVPQDVRRRYVAEEVRRGVESVEPGDRAAFLAELDRQVPWVRGAYGVGVQIDGGVGGGGDGGKADGRTHGAAEGGAHHDDHPSHGQLAGVEGVLNMEGARADLSRVLELAPHLVTFAATLSQLTWSAWRTIATRSSVRRGVNLEKLFAKCVAGDPAITVADAAGELDRLRQLIASLVWAISQVGPQVAAGLLAGFAPIEIESAVAAEGSSYWTAKGKEVACWRKYLELAEGLERDAVETAVQQLIVDHAEQVLKNTTRGERK